LVHASKVEHVVLGEDAHRLAGFGIGLAVQGQQRVARSLSMPDEPHHSRECGKSFG
jgi:hypothetical protein